MTPKAIRSALAATSDRLHLAAIHAKRRTGHPARAVRDQEGHQLRDLLRLAVAECRLPSESWPSPSSTDMLCSGAECPQQ